MEIPKPDPLPGPDRMRGQADARRPQADTAWIEDAIAAERSAFADGMAASGQGRGALAPRGRGPSDLHGSRLLLEPGPRHGATWPRQPR